MLGLNEYANAFKNGLNYILYGDEENRKAPVLDKSNIESIGYYDGYNYGIYCERTGQTMSIKQEHLIAVIDKCHTQAIKTQMEYVDEENKYIRYKNGFVDGKLEVLEKIMTDDVSFNKLPEVDNSDFISLGYYDGYSYFLKDFVDNGFRKDSQSRIKIDEISRKCFEQRRNTLVENRQVK